MGLGGGGEGGSLVGREGECRVAVLGEPGVGKTALVARFVRGEFPLVRRKLKIWSIYLFRSYHLSHEIPNLPQFKIPTRIIPNKLAEAGFDLDQDCWSIFLIDYKKYGWPLNRS